MALFDRQVNYEGGGFYVQCQRQDVDVIRNELASIGLLKDSGLDFESGKLWLPSSSNCWKDHFFPFFSSIDSFKEAALKKNDMPSYCYVEGGIPEDLRRSLEFYYAWKNVLTQLAHHEGSKSDPYNLVYFTEKDSVLKKFEISYYRDLKAALDVSPTEQELRAISEIRRIVEAKDVHSEEKAHILRASLLEVLTEEENIFSCAEKFKKKYDQRYEVYVSKFSINKVVSEIEEQTANYLIKIQEAVNSQQGKAYAVPGALVGIGALLRAGSDNFDVVLILVGLCSIFWFIYSANKLSKESFDSLKLQIERAYSKYERVLEGSDEIRGASKEAKIELNISIDKAKDRLDNINKVSFVLLAFVFAYFLLKLGFFGVAVDFFKSVFPAMLGSIKDYAAWILQCPVG